VHLGACIKYGNLRKQCYIDISGENVKRFGSTIKQSRSRQQEGEWLKNRHPESVPSIMKSTQGVFFCLPGITGKHGCQQWLRYKSKVRTWGTTISLPYLWIYYTWFWPWIVKIDNKQLNQSKFKNKTFKFLCALWSSVDVEKLSVPCYHQLYLNHCLIFSVFLCL
jgi:hypothetical protein